ncbi:PREDICTED: uncharacterized protein LOC105359004 [Ceratosolen solmsi marchali]|uniref:Uncharacterized protein LOC105359004 n=1 Tax=Ceratosolen solmsi marchali TaxID=326594 RepID=A0AAJ6VJB7_9HYME|nr:PREDICTED: uncharacterized protein LOC105359004 [Ceratosolen solmsi marchali]
MPVNLTVNERPIGIRRGKMVLSDLENIKKSEREHRRRLRSEQVREQSRALSKRILERTRQIEKEQLSRLERDANTEMKKAHDRKLMAFQRRYQDIENIGYAHKNALNQPNVEEIRNVEEQQNKAAAKIRGAKALKQLHEANQIVDTHVKKQQRLLEVRSLENERSSMVSKLPKKPSIVNNHLVESSDNENVKTASKRRVKCIISKKSPVKKLKDTRKVPCISVTAPNDDVDKISPLLTTCIDESKPSSSNKLSNFSQKGSDNMEEGTNANICESDNEPRKTVPTSSSVYSKPENLIRYNKQNYQNISSDLSTTCTTSSSSISDDSSYFSDTCKVSTVKKVPSYQPAPVHSKPDLYEHKTRQKNAYSSPSIFKKTSIKNKPSAEDLAQEIIELENKKPDILTSQKPNSQQRSQDAMLRDKIRRDYQALLKNLDLLSKEERKLKANKISDAAKERMAHPIKSSDDHMRRQQKMDRAFQTILRSSQDPGVTLDSWPERPITLTPRNYLHSDTISTTTWRAPPYINEKVEESCSESDDEFTRKRKISDLLLKIEKLKKRLLQEYGADLPDEIFNASVKSLFNYSNSASQQQLVNADMSKPKPTVPEIQVINMSSCDEALKPTRKVINHVKKSNTTQVSSKNVSKLSSESSVSTRDQQVQVELETVNRNTKSKDETSVKPLESLVTIVTPKISESSSSICSDSSVITDVVVGVNKKEITVLPKTRESNVKCSKNGSTSSSVKSRKFSTNKTPVKISFEQKSGSAAFEVAGLLIDANKKKITILPRRRKIVSKNASLPTESRKSYSLPGSRDTSPSNKGSKSAPPSQQCSPKKFLGLQKDKTIEQQSTNFERHRYRTQYTQVSIDSSTESSQLNYTSETAAATGSGRLFRSFKTLMSKQTITKMQDSSDASTTYASPPAATAGSMLNSITRTTPILELLNSSINEVIKRQVSPVSSPETPSPRTMKLPSNVRRSDKANKNLKFSSLIHKQTIDPPKSPRASKMTSNDTKVSQTTKQMPPQSHMCTCKNRVCKLLHENTEDIQSFVLNRCPEILEKFEDLKNNCTERIASLTDSIQKLRNEQKGKFRVSSLSIACLELAVAVNEDANPVGKIISNGQLSRSFETSRLVNSIEAIHTQLKRKLLESRKIISSKGMSLPKSPVACSYADKSSSISIDLSKDITGSESLEEHMEKPKNTEASSSNSCAKPRNTEVLSSNACAKPKIVSDERVNIKLNHFRLEANSRMAGGANESCKPAETTSKVAQEQILSALDQNEEMVEMLSKEILEQSKSINKSVAMDSLKDSDEPILKPSKAVSKDLGESDKNEAASDNNQSINLDTSISDFIPLLAGIPKIPRTLTKGPAHSRGRPPVTLISGPYSRTEIVSPAHELSTIVEFDTPDTVNKSHVSKSPSTKCRRKLANKEGTQSITSSPSKITDAKLNKCKPSVHVAPLLAQRSPQRALHLSNRLSSKNVDKSPRKYAVKSSESQNREILKSEVKNGTSSDSLHTLPDIHIEQLQQSQDNADGNNEFRISEISEMHSLPDENIDRLLISDLPEETRFRSATTAHKRNEQKCLLSSSSSISFSGLSGVSEITTTPTSDLNLFKYPSSPEEMELALKKWGLGWAIPTLKKTREASALGSSSSSDVTPVNNVARLVSPVKKQQDITANDLPIISDVSSISIKHANKSTEQSVLVLGRTSTPNRLSNTHSDETVSTLGSFSSDLNIIVENHSADITVPNISFSNDKLV